jgi:hypothetical protein
MRLNHENQDEALEYDRADAIAGAIQWDMVICRSVGLVDSGDFEAGCRCVIGGAAPDNEELHGHAAAYVFSKMGVDVLVSTEF